MTPSHNRRRVLAGLWDAAWLYRRRTLAAIGLLLLAKVATVCVPLLLKAIVDQFSRPEGLAQSVPQSAAPDLPAGQIVLVIPVFLLLSYALLRFAGTLFTELRDLVFAPVTRRTVIAMSQRAFSHLLSLSPRFHVQRNTGSLIRDVERGTAGVGFLLGAGLFTVVPTLVEFVGVLLVMASGYSLWFTLIIMVTFVVYGAVTMGLTQKRELRQRRVNEMDSRANGRLVDSLLNYETVKTYAREDYERRRYAEICDEWVRGSVHNQRALSGLHISQSAIIAGGVAAVMMLAAEQTVRGVMTVGDLVLVNAYVIQICMPLNALGFVFREASDALVNTEKLFNLLDQRPDIADQPGTPPLQVKEGVVSFENVDFSYEAGRQVLYGASLTIGAGQTVAVVGGSGSGKSTLARLLLRLYDVNQGRITVDGQDIRHTTVGSLREAIGVVPQDTVLFNDTIAYNIAYGRQGAGMADVIEAAKAAQVHEFILSLPQQYETTVGERGLKLSGGEKQRIAIARAFLKNPPIMIFDEATSALDTRAERAIQSELDRIAEGRTTLVIAHRLSTIVNADEIVVMDKGRIVERGKHDDLLAHGGLYAQLWSLQRQQAQFERLERQLARQPVNLVALVANAIDGLREAIDARQVRLYTDVDIDNASVTGDPTTLAQALREVCVWALDATPVGGRVAIKLDRVEGRVRLSVTDGRDAASSPHLAASDWQRPHGTDTPVDPMELRSTLERQGGTFHIEPPGSVKGMRYVMELPLRAVTVEPAAPARGEEPPMHTPADPLQGLSIMVIDDNADAREALGMVLSVQGAEVLSFGRGHDALSWLASHPSGQWPDLLVCDIMLDEEDGHTVMRQVRQLEEERHVPLDRSMPAIALTGLAEAGDRMRALMAGFQVHLVKPVEPDELIQTLFNLAGRHGGDSAPGALPPTGMPPPASPRPEIH
ncbi:ABC transporter transmembrane domain-containing protein [Piscinibacter gummiphilus]|uniref:ABC transporter transmembrane domain-containing protein n=1 Tax=Piscinibacter gummiphilus TaxID=946333 RepID=A0ABZ0CSR0_9BURK|nr:ABC transporter transmembrane domain-containing protein [Piscinibacter gummiphilus]WOB06131.1 ABC transporter transmembrane domain-containing protein [Piscinibacter gummiphilus]